MRFFYDAVVLRKTRHRVRERAGRMFTLTATAYNATLQSERRIFSLNGQGLRECGSSPGKLPVMEAATQILQRANLDDIKNTEVSLKKEAQPNYTSLSTP